MGVICRAMATSAHHPRPQLHSPRTDGEFALENLVRLLARLAAREHATQPLSQPPTALVRGTRNEVVETPHCDLRSPLK